MDQHEFLDMEVVLDSGAADHVIDKADAPDYELKESAGSRAGACFVAANGERIPNQGEVQLQMKLGATPICILVKDINLIRLAFSRCRTGRAYRPCP